MEKYQESILRDPGALVLAEQLSKAGIAFHYVGNLCFEVRNKKRADIARNLLAEIPTVRYVQSFRIGDRENSKYFVEVCL